MAADGLGPEAEGALRRAAAPGVETQVRVQQIADEILLNLQIPLVRIDHPRQNVHVGDHFALAVVDDLPVGTAIRKAVDLRERPAFGDFFACEIKFLAPNPVNGRRGLERFSGQHRGVRADKPDGRGRVLLFDRLGHFAIVPQRRGGSVDDDVLEPARDFQTLLDSDVVGRAIEQLAIRHQGGRLGQPGRVPIGGDLAPGLIARAGAAVKPIETRWREE